jgi:hypothetical protein
MFAVRRVASHVWKLEEEDVTCLTADRWQDFPEARRRRLSTQPDRRAGLGACATQI